MQLTFTNPEYLVLLFLVPIIVFVHFFAIRVTKKTAIKFSNFEALARIRGIDIISKNMVVLILSCIIIAVIAFSLSGPVLSLSISSSKFSYVIAIDSSESMLADDLDPNRLEVAKENALSFVENTPLGTRIGVISFSGNALVETRVTQEKDEVKKAILNINYTDIGGTDISESLITSTNLLLDEDYKSIILISDGQINTGKLDKALDYAVRNNVVIHTIGVGTIEGGNTTYGLSKLDEESLQGIAYNTGGNYYNMQNGDSLSGSFSDILEFRESNVPIKFEKYFMIIALILFLLEFILINTRYKMYP